jgi:hypothetical protein
MVAGNAASAEGMSTQPTSRMPVSLLAMMASVSMPRTSVEHVAGVSLFSLRIPICCLVEDGEATTCLGLTVGTIPNCTDASTPPSLLVSLLKDDVISDSCVPLAVAMPQLPWGSMSWSLGQ